MSSTMRFLSYLVTLLIVVFVAACGGGGGSPGAISGSGGLRTGVPSGLTMVVTDVRTFAVEGGKPPYSVTSNREGIAVAGIDGSTLAIGGVFPGTAELTIRDALGQKVTAAVTITENGLTLSTSAPSALTLQLGQSQTYPIRGGIAPYTVTSANPNIVSAALSGANNSSLTLTGITPGSAAVVVRDSLGASVNISVTVTTVGNLALFTTAPSSVTLPTGSTTADFSIGGGVPFSGTNKYAVSSNNTGVATVVVSENTFTIRGVGPGVASIVIRDSVNKELTIGVTVTSPASVPLATTAPSVVTIAATTNQTYSVSGGVGSYTITNTNPFNVGASISGTGGTGGTLTLTGLLVGSSTITVRDGAGAQVVITAGVITPGSSLTLLPASLSIAETNNDAIDLNIFGGVAPYHAFTTDATLAPVVISGSTFRIVASGAATQRCVTADKTVTLTVIDSQGASATSNLTIVNGSAPPTATCP